MEEAVGVVLEHQDIVAASRLEDRLAALLGERGASRVLVRRDQVGEVRALCELGIERLRVDAVGVERDGHDLDAEPLEQQQRAVVGRVLDEHACTATLVGGTPRDHLGEQREALERAGGDDDPGGFDAMALGEPGAQWLPAAPGAVAEHLHGIVLEGAGGGGAQLVDGQHLGCGYPAGEGDQVHVGSLTCDAGCQTA